MIRPSFQSPEGVFSFQLSPKRLKRISVDVSRSAFNTSEGMLSGPNAFPFFGFSVACLISSLVGFLMLIGRDVSAGGKSALFRCGQFNS